MDLDNRVELSDLGPVVLGCFAFIMLLLGLMYIFRPEQTGRSLTASASEIRKTGYVICVLASTLFYCAYLWWKP
jgi:Ca2+/Na+ antiporter